MQGKNKISILILTYILVIHAARGASVELSKLEKTTIPLMFGTNMEYQEYSLLPSKVVLVYQGSFDEGFSRYKLKVKIKKGFNYKRKNDGNIYPLWLFSVSDDEVSGLIHYHPVSKLDLLKIVKHNGITRSQLIDILRRWDEIEEE